MPTPMNERNIVFFPMQSVQIGTDELDNPIYDNAADAEILQKLRQREIRDGVYPDESTYLQVMSNNNMTVTVKAGYAHIQGIQVWIKEDVVLTAETAETLVDRVDRVVLRLSFPDRDVTLAIKKGDVTLNRDPGQTWELGLADLAVAKNNAVITQIEITDLRLDPVSCGVVAGFVQVDTETIFNQYMEWWAEQTDTTGYLTKPGEYTELETDDKTVLGAINEVNENKAEKAGTEKLSINASMAEFDLINAMGILRLFAHSTTNTYGIALINPDNGSIISTPLVIDESGHSNLVEIADVVDNTGWTLGTTLTYVSATQATIVGNWTGRIRRFDKIRFKQGGAYKYNYVVSAPSYSAGTGLTTLTITGGFLTTAGDCSFAIAAITDFYFSHVENPVGFPHWFSIAAPVFDVTTATNGTTGVQPTTFFTIFKIASGNVSLVVKMNALVKKGAGKLIAFTLPVTLPNVADAGGLVAVGTCYLGVLDIIGGAVTKSTTQIYFFSSTSITDNQSLQYSSIDLTYKP